MNRAVILAKLASKVPQSGAKATVAAKFGKTKLAGVLSTLSRFLNKGENVARKLSNDGDVLSRRKFLEQAFRPAAGAAADAVVGTAAGVAKGTTAGLAAAGIAKKVGNGKGVLDIPMSRRTALKGVGAGAAGAVLRKSPKVVEPKKKKYLLDRVTDGATGTYRKIRRDALGGHQARS